MNLTKYAHIPFTITPNKNMIPIVEMNFDQVGTFNKIYQYVRKKYIEVKPTTSQAISTKGSLKYHYRYQIAKGNQRFEMVIICEQGCFRFLLHNEPKKENCISGQAACRSFYKWADNFHINLAKYVTRNGKEVKEKIQPPHLEILFRAGLNRKFKHVHHIDFHSSYASRIAESYPELKPMLEEIYRLRKENNGLYKHVLTNAIGCFQSKFCVDYYSRHKVAPFQFAEFSKIAINGTRKCVDDIIVKLKKKGYVPILSNTDGVWYYSHDGTLYSDINKGPGLCQWEHDHVDCEFLMTSVGCYQFVENGVCQTVLRGLSNLDVEEPDRTKWEFGYILNVNKMLAWKFDVEKGVIKV